MGDCRHRRATADGPGGEAERPGVRTSCSCGRAGDFLRGDRVLLGITVMVALTNLLDLAWARCWCRCGRVERAAARPRSALLFATFAGASALGSLVRRGLGRPAAALRDLPGLLPGDRAAAVRGHGVRHPAVGGVLALVVVAGFASGFLNPILGAVIFERIPAPLMGRVTSLSTRCASR